MSRLQKLRVFVGQRLDAALEEILAVFEKTLVRYEQEAALNQQVISRQHALLCALHKPLVDLSSADAFTQQLMVSHKEAPPEDQEDPEPPQVRVELQDLDEADIIQFTYSRPGSTRTEPGSAGPDQEVQLVSSETEDSDDYSKDPAGTRSTPTRPKPKRGHRPESGLRCWVCSRTFKSRQFLLRHIKAHLQEAEPVCGVCGERFEASESLKIHIQTHQTTQQNQPRTRGRETRCLSEPNTNVQTRQREHTCENCGRSFLQVWKKRKHRCVTLRKKGDGPEGTKT
ncbi:uncharacterized protein [Pagrus major]|uniref:uncharacterized protein n=1 Tax=Pagrus major TaxID=143350 RepID=UPI003CC8A2AF